MCKVRDWLYLCSLINLNSIMRKFIIIAYLCCFLITPSCNNPDSLIVYCSLDQDLSETIISEFEEKYDVEINVQYDVERNKTVGLVSRLIAESSNPQAHVFWNNEIAHTIRLKNIGVTAPYYSPSTAGLPKKFIDPENHYAGFAARARVIMYRTDITVKYPIHLNDFLKEEFASSGIMAQPLTGTTLSNFAYLIQQNSPESTIKWFKDVEKAGMTFASGNADAMRRVCKGDFEWCFTDTDDAAKAIKNGYPVAIHFLDQGNKKNSGAMLIPNSICLIQGAENNKLAHKFIDFVLSPETETKLANSLSRQIPLNSKASIPENMLKPYKDFQVLEIDWETTAATLDDAAKTFQRHFVN